MQYLGVARSTFIEFDVAKSTGSIQLVNMNLLLYCIDISDPIMNGNESTSQAMDHSRPELSCPVQVQFKICCDCNWTDARFWKTGLGLF